MQLLFASAYNSGYRWLQTQHQVSEFHPVILDLAESIMPLIAINQIKIMVVQYKFTNDSTDKLHTQGSRSVTNLWVTIHMSPIKVTKLILCEPFGLHPLLSNPVNDLIAVFCCDERWIVTGSCLGFPATNGSLTDKYRISVNAHKRIKEPWSYTYQSENVSSWKIEATDEFPE